jgi:hypothetical protein
MNLEEEEEEGVPMRPICQRQWRWMGFLTHDWAIWKYSSPEFGRVKVERIDGPMLGRCAQVQLTF